MWKLLDDDEMTNCVGVMKWRRATGRNSPAYLLVWPIVVVVFLAFVDPIELKRWKRRGGECEGSKTPLTGQQIEWEMEAGQAESEAGPA
jgi:hypothetical protein